VKLHVLSDLHLSRGALAIPGNDADAVVLAGDIARPREAVAWAAGLAKPVLYVPGNHEFYGGSIAGTVAELKRLCAGTAIRVLDNEETFLSGVRFLGTTLWTDFRLFGEGEKRAAAMGEAQRLMRDFGARLWIHGHTHDSFDYRLDGTRVVCNPRGYAKDGANENPLFDAGFMIEIA
jgi:predicted phosphodiesterase